MSKKLKSIIIGLVVLLLLGGVVALLMLMPEKTDEDSSIGSSSEMESFELYSIKEKGDIKSVQITNEKGSYEISRVGEDKYAINEYDGLLQLDADYASVISSVMGMTSFNKIEEDSTNAKDFGLDNPVATVKVVTKDKEYEVSYGINSPDGVYTYTQIKGDDAIYAMSASSVAYAFKNQEQYLDKLILEAFNKEDPDSIPTIKSMNIYREDLIAPIKVVELTGSEKEEGSKTMANPYKMVSPIESAMSTNTSEKVIYNLFGLTAQEVIVGNPSEMILAEYGFDDKSPRAELKYNNSAITLIAGNAVTKEDGTASDTHYVYVPENKMIYTVLDASMEWLRVTPKQLISTIAHLVYIGDLSGLDFTVQGKEYKFDLKTVKDEEDRDVTTAKRDGKEVDIDNFKKLLQLAFDTPVDDIYLDEPVQGEPNVSITYRRTDGVVDVVSMYGISDRVAVLSVNGVQKYTARLAYVDKLQKEIQNLIDGNKVSVDW